MGEDAGGGGLVGKLATSHGVLDFLHLTEGEEELEGIRDIAGGAVEFLFEPAVKSAGGESDGRALGKVGAESAAEGWFIGVVHKKC